MCVCACAHIRSCVRGTRQKLRGRDH
jgi:hypothetical protein